MPVMVVEHKSTVSEIGLGSTYWKVLSLDSQVSLYCEGVRSLGHDVYGVLYDVLRKPQHRPMESKNEQPEAYGKRVLAAIGEDPERYYQRGTVVRLDAERDESALDVWQTALSLRDARRLKIYPKNADSCMSWSRACDYLSVCCGEASIEDPVLFQISPKKHSELDTTDENLLTQSSLRSYRSCPRKYYYRYELRARPLAAEARTLKTGKSLHAALEAWWRSGGDLELALTKLDTDEPFVHAKEAAMIVGYHAKWDRPEGVIAVEKEWTMDLVNPETGAKSKTFRLGGRVDCIVRAPA